MFYFKGLQMLGSNAKLHLVVQFLFKAKKTKQGFWLLFINPLSNMVFSRLVLKVGVKWLDRCGKHMQSIYLLQRCLRTSVEWEQGEKEGVVVDYLLSIKRARNLL